MIILRYTLILIIGTLTLQVQILQAETPIINGCLTGIAYRDCNCNGIRDLDEPLFSGLAVEVYDCSNNLAGTGLTGGNGVWSVCGLTNGDKYRVEFILDTNQDIWANPSHVGADNGTDVRFVTSPATGIDFGLSSPADYCESDPLILTNCFSTGAYNDPAVANEYAIIGLNDSYLDDPDGNVNGSMSASNDPFNSGPNYFPARPPATQIALLSEVGSVWGMDKSETQNKLYSSAYVKSGSSLGPTGSSGTIYVTDDPGGNPTTSVYVDLNAVFGAGTTGADPHPAGTTDFSYPNDVSTNALIGKTGLGDMDLSLDESTIYVVNMEDRQLYAIPTSGPLNTFTIQRFPIPNTALPTEINAAGDPGTCPPEDVRPFGTGVDAFGNIYVGAVCSAESISAGVDAEPNNASYQMTAYVWKFDGTNFTLVLDESLRFNRDHVNDNSTYGTYDDHVDGSNNNDSDWEPWHDFSASVYNTTGMYQNEPMLADIEFDINGDMLLGMRDRSGDVQSLYSGFTSSGDVYKACETGPCAWQFESDATCGGTTTGGQGNGEGPDGGEFYFEDRQGDGVPNSGTGGLYVVPKSDEVISSAIDPVYLDSNGNEVFVPNAGGLQVHNNDDGTITGAYNLYEADNDNSVFKAAGIGDVEACCGAAPLEIGNYVWCDTIPNGIQDPCEDPVDGIKVELYDSNGLLVGQDVTTNGGTYYFNETNVDTTGISGGNPNTSWSGINYDSKYYIVYGNGQYNNNLFSISGDDYTIINNPDVNGNSNDNIDSDVSPTVLTSGSIGSIPNGLPFICIQSDRIGCGNHRYDLGLNCCTSPNCFGIEINRN